ncbi:hypothetical protein NAEGRDRAFT_80465 [Naegleria gruberi]|uniref:Guanylate cyclase domain-containing protein n=1 Tax=Naegleria gruberi TaxID=5762 RepID=D2VLN4_NAEGR|nr:uncharacterized protein NAEGRDRAFT_80465 [Naegleria gruberi]EFC42421.1 hypothetical protein NAEGRDRAFT_80465 [Naegleria gruberi]|eukprot:XP_002675165.1 hypothetical protein NAEGRDRAFT_80465 [Naegleria gruberi strain NEG-M]
MAEDYNLGLVPRQPSLAYLYKYYNTFKPYGIGLFFNDSLDSVNVYGAPPNEIVVWYHTPTTEFMLYAISLDTSTPNTTAKSLVKASPNYEVNAQSYWKTTFGFYSSLGLDGVFGIPYAIPGNPSYTTYYCAKLYDPTYYSNGIKKVVGITKTNISLRIIESFLKTVQVLTSGYVIVAETNNLVIGGNINTTALDGSSRVSLFDLIDKGSGSLLNRVYQNYKGWTNTPIFIDFDGFFIVKSNFTLVNLEWNVFIVVDKQEVEMVTNITTGVSVGITILIIIVGVIMSITIGHIVTNPFTILEREFMKIKTMELDQVNITASKFKEVDLIYLYLYEMTVWLNEIKTFIPESVFLQLRNMKEENTKKTDESQANTKSKKHKNHPVSNSDAASIDLESHGSRHFSNNSSRTSSMASKVQEVGNSLFKIGLNCKQGAVVRIKLIDFSTDLNVADIGHIFSKIVSGLSAVSKSIQGDFQVITVDDYQIYVSSVEGNGRKSSNVLALEAALKLRKLLVTINETSKTHIRCAIGVSSGKCYAGNLGTSSFRTFSVVGSVPINAEKLAFLADDLRCDVLADEGTMDESTLKKFVSRPVDKLMEVVENSQEGKVSVVYEVEKENTIEGDEWMYELEQQKANQKFSEFGKYFFYDKNFEGLNNDEIINMLRDYEANLTAVVQNDEYIKSYPARKLIKSIGYFAHILESSGKNTRFELFKQYYSTVNNQVQEVYPPHTTVVDYM